MACSAAGLDAAPTPLTTAPLPSSLSAVMSSEQMLVAADSGESLAPYTPNRAHAFSSAGSEGGPGHSAAAAPEAAQNAKRNPLGLSGRLVPVVYEPVLINPAPRSNNSVASRTDV